LQDERRAALERGLPFEAEMRALRKDGQYRWFLVRYNPFRNEQGQVIRWYATGIDIDDRVKAEDRTRNENLALREQSDRDSMFEDIVGSSESLRKVLRQIAKIAPSDSTVLVLGETGTGKELIARAIHKRSGRAERAFIGVSCAAIPASLVSSDGDPHSPVDGKWWAHMGWIQHSAHIPPGRDGLFNLVKSIPQTLRYESGTVVAEGDFVILHGRFSGLGLPVNWIVADIVLVKDGIPVEHWDVIQDEATRESSKSGLPMFGEKFGG